MNIQFWLRRYAEATVKAVISHEMKCIRTSQRYLELSYWIEQRILKKYGKKDNPYLYRAKEVRR